MPAQALANCRVQFLRGTLGNGLQRRLEAFAAHGPELWAARHDLSDGEKAATGQTLAHRMTRFQLRAIGTVLTVTPKDRLRVATTGEDYDILGIKMLTGGRLVEITAAARAEGEFA